LLEPACAVAAAQRADITALRALDRFWGFAERDHSALEYAEHDRAFHHNIADLSENPRMTASAQDR
jgi:DNA-binding FadR family transcriptional regulator